MEIVTLDVIYKNIKELRKEVAEIREHMVDIDCILTEDDLKALEEYRLEKSEGRLTTHEDLKKELGL